MTFNKNNKRILQSAPYQFLSGAVNEIDEICKPLLKLGIDGFFYLKFYPDGTYANYSNKLNMPYCTYVIEKYFSEQYSQESIIDLMYMPSGISLWEHNPQNTIWKEARDEFNLGYGACLFKEHDDYTEMFCFFTSKKDYAMNEFFINNVDLLELFTNYFHDRARHLLNPTSKQRFIIPEKYCKNEMNELLNDKSIEVDHFLSDIMGKGLILGKKYDYCRISKREIECLYWLIQGKTAQEIAVILNISKRTVESHFARLKLKTKARNSHQLILIATELGLKYLPSL